MSNEVITSSIENNKATANKQRMPIIKSLNEKTVSKEKEKYS